MYTISPGEVARHRLSDVDTGFSHADDRNCLVKPIITIKYRPSMTIFRQALRISNDDVMALLDGQPVIKCIVAVNDVVRRDVMNDKCGVDGRGYCSSKLRQPSRRLLTVNRMSS